MSDNINVGYNGVQTSFGNDSFYNGFPNSTPAVVGTGVATQEISLLESQKYTIDIYNDMKKFAPNEFPIMTILENINGKPIDQFFDMWTDDNEGLDVIDVALDQLRVRDASGQGTTPNKPFALSSLGEIGGELIFQFAGLTSGSNVVSSFDGITDSSDIKISSIASATRPTAESQYGAEYLRAIKIKEMAPVYNSTSTKKLLTLGYHRTGTNTEDYSVSVGRIAEVIRKYQNTLEVNDYTANNYTDVTINGGAGDKWYEYKYAANSSFQVHQIFDNIEFVDTKGAIAAQESKIQLIVGINRFMFNDSLSAFVLELDFNEANIDMFQGTSGTDVAGNSSSFNADTAKYYQLVQSGNHSSYPVGSIYKIQGGGTGTGAIDTCVDAEGNDLSGTLNTSDYVFQLVEQCVMLEETNTAKDANRPFGVNIGSDYSNPQGCTRIARHVTINRFNDVVDPSAELDGFDTELKGNYVRTNEIHQNFLQIINMKPWAISTMRKATGIRFGDTVQITRERHLRQYKRMWTNVLLYGKKSNLSLSETNYKGTTSGILDFEMFPIKYGSFPIPVDRWGSNTADEDVKGQKLKRWMEDFARAANATSVPGTYEGKTVAVGIEIINWLETNTAVAGSSQTNAFGMQFTAIPPSKATFGLKIYEFVTTFGILRFVHEPALDFTPNMLVPRHLYSSGKISPRFTALVLDKNFIELKTHKARPDKIYGNLQANNQPFFEMEGISGAKLLKLRFPRNHGVFNLQPNY